MRRVRALIDAHKAMQLGRHHEAECRPDAAQPAPAAVTHRQAESAAAVPAMEASPAATVAAGSMRQRLDQFKAQKPASVPNTSIFAVFNDEDLV